MFYFLSKTIYLLGMPFMWVFGLLIYALFAKRKRAKNIALFSGILMLYLFSNGVLVNKLMLAWEIPPTPFSEVSKHYKVGVVLSGIMNQRKSPADRFYTQKGADRVLHAALLYHKGMVDKLLVSGSFTRLTGEAKSEAELLKDLLVLCHVKEEDIWMEHQARNTRENATYSVEILKEQGIAETEALLITSAFHIRRSVGCFEKAGYRMDTFSADVYTIDPEIDPMNLLIPSEGAFSNFNLLIHELIGYVVYKLMGYA